MGPVYTIGVAGRSCCGKTLFAKKLCSGFSPADVTLLQQDDYYRDLGDIPLEDREVRNFDQPQAFDLPLLMEHLEELRAGRAVRQPVYDFHNHQRTDQRKEIIPGKVVLLEGLLIFHPPQLRDLLDLRIYIEGDDTECLIRRLRRDVEERGRSYESVLGQYQKTVHPMYLKYVLPGRPYAHLIVPGNSLDGPVVEVVRGTIMNIVRGYKDSLMETG